MVGITLPDNLRRGFECDAALSKRRLLL